MSDGIDGHGIVLRASPPSMIVLEVAHVDGHFVHREPSDVLTRFEPHNGYHIIPKA